MSVNLSRDVSSRDALVVPATLPLRSVEREALLASLEQADDARALTVSAGAGYGKTTVLAQWADRWRLTRGPVIWLRVPPMAESLDIAAHIARQIAPETCGESLPTAYDDATWSSVTIPRLRECLGTAAEAYLIVLDDAMNLADARAGQLLDALATGLPEGSQLALGTRGAVPPALRRLRPTSRSVEWGPADLAMSVEEAEELLRADGSEIPPDRVREVVRRTEGWPVGVFLMGRALVDDPDLLDVEGDTHLAPSWITDYLRDELFDVLDPDAATFLLSVSVLEELEGEVCDAVSEQEGSLALLRTLAARNTLISRTDHSDERYRFHQLFAEFLRDEAQARSRSAHLGAHRRAFDWYRQHGDLERAMPHGRQMDQDDLFGQVLWDESWRYFTVGQMPTVRRWLEPVSDERTARHASLTLARFYCGVHEGAREQTLWATEVLRGQVRRGDLTPHMKAQAAVASAVVGAGGLEQVRDDSSVALDVLLAARDPWATVALFLRGVAHAYLGDVTHARHDLFEGAALSEALGVVDMRSHCLAALAGFSLLEGEPKQALPLAIEARELAQKHDLGNVAAMSPVFTSSAAVLAANGLQKEASSDAMRALRLMSLMESIAPWHSLAGRLMLAQVFWMLGDAQRAGVLLHEAKEWEGPATRSPVLGKLATQVARAVDAGTASGSGASALTTAELKVLQYLPTHLSFPEIGAQLYLSRHTIKSQAVSAYRKLGVSSRSEAVERARELGLLPVR